MRLQNEFLTKWTRYSISPILVFVVFVLGEHSLALSRQICGVNLQTLAKSTLISGQLPMNGWGNISDFLAPAGQKSPTEIIRISNKTMCFASRLPSYYLSFMPLIQTHRKIANQNCRHKSHSLRARGEKKKD